MGADRTYDSDLSLWAEDQARAQRSAAHARINLPIDWQNVAAEIEGLGKSQARELAGRIETILVHLIKLQASPASNPRIGWRAIIQRQRNAIDAVLRDSPSLRQTIPAVIEAASGKARRAAELELADFGEQPQIELSAVGYFEGQVVGDWFPI
jgi:hypothetical protein